MISRIDDNDFRDEVLFEKRLVMVDFSAEWCMPCRMLRRVLENISRKNEAVKIVNVDVDESPQMSNRYGISNLPTIVFFKDGRPVDEIVGFVPEDYIEDIIEENL
ncbi:MAG: thioredoxin [Clostridium butyricum]|nr:thioredoxin [Clostridium butyricum]